MTINEAQDAVIEEFSDFSDWMDKYQMLIDLGNDLEPLAEQYKNEQNLIDGCQSRVWLQCDNVDGKLVFTADSDALITKGSSIISNYFIHRGDYWKIESFSIGYTIDVSKRFLNHLRLYATANNLYTFTHFPGIDPSTYQVNGLTPGTLGGTTAYYPSVFQFIFGFQATF